VTLNDLNGMMAVSLRHFTEFGSFGSSEASSVNLVKTRRILSATKYCSKNLDFGSILFTMISQAIADKECVKERCPHSEAKKFNLCIIAPPSQQ